MLLMSCDEVSGPNFVCLEAGDHFLLNDGSLARITEISDLRCPCFADCLYSGQVGLTILIGTDTILAAYEGYGFGDTLAQNTPVQFIYQTRRGDQIEVLDYGPSAFDCPGTVPQELFCLQLTVLN